MILITGGSGLLGSFLAEEFVKKGFSVSIYCRNEPKHTSKNISWIQGDILDIHHLRQTISRFETVIHAAAVVSFSSKRADELYKINVEGTANVVNCCLNDSNKKLIFISSVAAIGRKNLVTKVDESSMWDDTYAHSHYAISKHMAEREVWRGFEEGLNGFIVNPSVILAPSDWNQSSTKLFQHIWHNSKYYTSGSVNIVDVRDVVECVSLLFDKQINHERYILNGSMLSYKSFFELIAREFNKPIPSIKLPSWLLRCIAYVEYVRTYFTRKEPLISIETSKLSETSIFFDNQKITNSINFTFRDSHESIKWVCSTLVEKYKLKL